MVGTESALSASPVITEMVALRPVRSLLVSPLIWSSAPYWTALDEPLLAVGSELTDRTVALSLVSDCALSVTVAASPFFSFSESNSEKAALTCMPVGLVSTMNPDGVPLPELEPVLPDEDLEPLEPEPEPEPAEEPEEEATVSPTLPPTEATVPSAEAVSVVPTSAAWAFDSAIFALSTCCWAWATWASSTLVVVMVVVCGAGVEAPPRPLPPLPLPLPVPGICEVVVVVTPAWALVRLASAAVSADCAESTCC